MLNLYAGKPMHVCLFVFRYQGSHWEGCFNPTHPTILRSMFSINKSHWQSLNFPCDHWRRTVRIFKLCVGCVFASVYVLAHMSIHLDTCTEKDEYTSTHTPGTQAPLWHCMIGHFFPLSFPAEIVLTKERERETGGGVERLGEGRHVCCTVVTRWKRECEGRIESQKWREEIAVCTHMRQLALLCSGDYCSTFYIESTEEV